MTPDWTPLDSELSLWRQEGLTLPLWWRDDDATKPSAALDRLLDLSALVYIPVHLAIVPEAATPALASRIAGENVVPLVHGWAHRNHAPEDEKKAEFGASRPLRQRLADARRGLLRLADLLDTPPAPVFVPPWNRIGPDMAPQLAKKGYKALSAFGPRPDPMAAPGLAHFNTHVDPIDWRGTRSLADTGELIARLTANLADRREGRADTAEPLGLLTHHLVHDAAIWDFTQALLERLTAGPVTLWNARQPELNQSGVPA